MRRILVLLGFVVFFASIPFNIFSNAASERFIEEWEKSVSDLHRSVENLSHHNQKLLKENQHFSEQINFLKKDIQETKHFIEDFLSEEKAVRQLLQRKENAILSLKEEIEKSEEKKQDVFRKKGFYSHQIKQTEEKKENLQESIRRLIDDLSSKEKTQTSHKEQVFLSRLEHENEKKTIESSRILDQKRHQSFQDQLDHLRREEKLLLDNFNHLNEEKEAIRKELLFINENISQLVKGQEELEHDSQYFLREKKEMIKNLQDDIQETQNQKNHLEKALLEKTEKLTRIRRVKTNDQLQSLAHEVEELKQENISLLKQLSQLKKKLAETTKQVKSIKKLLK